MGSSAKPSLPVVLFKSQNAWRTWLSKNCARSPGVWLRIGRKSSDLKSVTHPEALDVALCYGWIDGQRKSHDAESFLQKFTPRGPRSIWSKINRARALQLIDEGRMHASGLEAIERAKANGNWEAAYDSYRTSAVPPDLDAALDKHPKAKAFFATLNSQNRYAILFRIQTARQDATRQRRIERFVRMLERHERLHP